MGWNTLVPGNDIENLKEDRKASKGIEQYRVSAKAIYTKGEYLPMSAITDVRIQRSTYTPSCACGKGTLYSRSGSITGPISRWS